MRRLREIDGSAVHRRHVLLHLSRCKGMSVLQDKLHDEANAAFFALRDAQRTREDAEDDVVKAAAELARSEMAIENAIREIDAEAKKIDRQDPTLGAHKGIFPCGATPVLEPDGQAQLDALPALHVRAAPFVSNGEMTVTLAKLDAAEADHQAALSTASAAATAVETRLAEERAARKAIREQLESAYGRLRDLYKAQPGRAEAFFLRER